MCRDCLFYYPCFFFPAQSRYSRELFLKFIFFLFKTYFVQLFFFFFNTVHIYILRYSSKAKNEETTTAYQHHSSPENTQYCMSKFSLSTYCPMFLLSQRIEKKKVNIPQTILMFVFGCDEYF